MFASTLKGIPINWIGVCPRVLFHMKSPEIYLELEEIFDDTTTWFQTDSF